MMFRTLITAVLLAGFVSSLSLAQIAKPTRFTVVVEGAGPDVVLLPGLSSSREVFDAEAKLLAGSYRLHRVQINGFAGAPAGPNAEGPILPGTVDELHQYIVTSRIHPAVIGHSLGGLLALMLADKHPEDVRAMMIVDALPFYGIVFSKDATVEMLKPQAQAITDKMLAMTPEEFAAVMPMMVGAMVKSPEGVKAVTASSLASDRRVYAHAMVEDMGTDVRPDLASIKTPAVLLYPVDPERQKEETVTALYTGAYGTMPNMKLVKVMDSRHFIMYDQPGIFDEQVKAFLK